MCIVLVTTSHPDYALIVIDNRDEFILRPTSRPHWWNTHPKPVAPPTQPAPVESAPATKSTSAPVSVPARPASTPSSASASTVVSAANSTAPSSSVNSVAPTPLSSSPPRDGLPLPQLHGPSPLANVVASAAGSLHLATSASGADKQQQQTLISVLSSRDLQRAERGTWLGITKGGNFAVLTNYRETDTHDAAHPIHAARSRGGMVTAWLAAEPEMSLDQFVEEMLRDGGTKGVGGFSLLCGKLRKRGKEIEPLAIISNRYDCPDQVPWVAKSRGETVGLSNTCFGDPDKWPKIEDGKRMLEEVVQQHRRKDLGTTTPAGTAREDELVESLFGILDTDSMPVEKGWAFEEYIFSLKNSIFISPIGDDGHKKEMEDARKSAPTRPTTASAAAAAEGDDEDLEFHAPPPEEEEEEEGKTAADNMQGFSTGMYGTQRQTVMLGDWEGNVRFTERALWDAWGRQVQRGKGDMTFRFKVDGWEEDRFEEGAREEKTRNGEAADVGGK